MEARIAELEAQMRRLLTDIEGLKTALCLLQRRKMDWFAKTCLALIVITIVLFGALWHRLGRI